MKFDYLKHQGEDYQFPVLEASDFQISELPALLALAERQIADYMRTKAHKLIAADEDLALGTDELIEATREYVLSHMESEAKLTQKILAVLKEHE